MDVFNSNFMPIKKSFLPSTKQVHIQILLYFKEYHKQKIKNEYFRTFYVYFAKLSIVHQSPISPHQNPGIHRYTVFINREVQVRAGALTGVTDVADALAGFDVGAGFDTDDAHVAVKRAVTGVVGDYDVVAVRVVVADLRDTPRHCGLDWCALDGAYVKPGVELPCVAKGVCAVAV